jgi:DNA-binding transcriptional LysR family regulator
MSVRTLAASRSSVSRNVRLISSPNTSTSRFPLYALYRSRHHPPAKTRAFLEFVMSLTPHPSK